MIENNTFKIIGSTGNEYTITRSHDGRMICDCIGFSNHEKCYHSSYVKDCLDKNISPKKVINKVVKIFN